MFQIDKAAKTILFRDKSLAWLGYFIDIMILVQTACNILLRYNIRVDVISPLFLLKSLTVYIRTSYSNFMLHAFNFLS